MHKISFYLIEKSQQRPADVACRLCQQIYQKHHIWLQFATAEQCQAFDLLLWQYQQLSFIPHGIDQFLAPICLSTQSLQPNFDVCINFSETAINVTELPVTALHIIEIVGNNEQEKIQARQRFKFYRQLRLNPQIHTI